MIIFWEIVKGPRAYIMVRKMFKLQIIKSFKSYLVSFIFHFWKVLKMLVNTFIRSILQVHSIFIIRGRKIFFDVIFSVRQGKLQIDYTRMDRDVYNYICTFNYLINVYLLNSILIVDGNIVLHNFEVWYNNIILKKKTSLIINIILNTTI